jgi:hypothetical protein
MTGSPFLKPHGLLTVTRQTPAAHSQLPIDLLPTTSYVYRYGYGCICMDADGASHSQKFENFLSEAY